MDQIFRNNKHFIVLFEDEVFECMAVSNSLIFENISFAIQETKPMLSRFCWSYPISASPSILTVDALQS